MKEIIRAEKISKEYITNLKMDKFSGKIIEKDVFFAVDNVDFLLNEGEFIAVMGPSGAGKSTFVNLISTIDTPTKGNVFINNQSIKVMSDKALAKIRYETIGFVFQNFNLLELLKNKENIAVPLTLMNVDNSTIDKKTNEIAKRLNIEKLLEKKPNECSGGEKQRVAIARALITNPKVIIADEPTGNLDSKNSKAVMSLFKELNKEEKITILIVTHDPIVASNANKVLYIKDGKINNIIEKGEKNNREFFEDVLNLVSEEAFI
ncbi:MAG: ABC transporter ATP-binding protein [Sarcina sp.]